MHTYRAYGLGIHSVLPLPELIAQAGAAPHVHIRFGSLNDALPCGLRAETYFHVTREEAVLYWGRAGTFVVRKGEEILVDPLPGVDEQVVRLPLLGTVMAVLLHQRGFLVLHASAVSMNGRAVAFAGEKGLGKSTLAATCYARGHNLLADDVVAVDLGGGEPTVLSAYPQFKLWPEAVAGALGGDAATLPELADGYEKRACRTGERFSQGPVPLERVYVLSGGSSLEIKPLQPREAMMQLITNSHVARFGRQFLRGEEASANLRHCMKVAMCTPVRRLERPISLSLLQETARLIESDLGCDAQAPLGIPAAHTDHLRARGRMQPLLD